MVTDMEKTIIDGLDLPQYVGGVVEIAKALSTTRTQLNESKLRRYAGKIGNSAVAKRLGFLLEILGLGNVEALRKVVTLAPGFSPLDLHFCIMENIPAGGVCQLTRRLRHDYYCRTTPYSGKRKPSLRLGKQD
jgi:hypothetical protein